MNTIGALILFMIIMIIRVFFGKIIRSRCKSWALKHGVNDFLSDFRFYRSWFGGVWIKIEKHDKENGLTYICWVYSHGLLPSEKALQVEYYEDSNFIKEIHRKQEEAYKQEGIDIKNYHIKIDY